MLMLLLVLLVLVSYSTISSTQSSDFNIYCVLRDALRTVALVAHKWATVAVAAAAFGQLPFGHKSQLGYQWLFMCKLYNDCCTYPATIGLLAIFRHFTTGPKC